MFSGTVDIVAAVDVGMGKLEYVGDKLLTDDTVDSANRCALLSNSLSANALRFRIRSVNGDTYIGYRL